MKTGEPTTKRSPAHTKDGLSANQVPFHPSLFTLQPQEVAKEINALTPTGPFALDKLTSAKTFPEVKRRNGFAPFAVVYP